LTGLIAADLLDVNSLVVFESRHGLESFSGWIWTQSSEDCGLDMYLQ